MGAMDQGAMRRARKAEAAVTKELIALATGAPQLPDKVIAILNGEPVVGLFSKTWIPVETFADHDGIYGDTPGDDTPMFNRATVASSTFGYGITLSAKEYNLTGWLWRKFARFRGTGSNKNFCSRIVPLTHTGGGTPPPVVTIDVGPVTKIDMEGFAIKANTDAANDNQICCHLQSVADGTSTGGLWWSRFKNIEISGFKLGIWLRAGTTGTLLPHQFNLWEHITIFRRTSAQSTCFLATGQVAQQVFTAACEFDGGDAGTLTGTNIAFRNEFSTDEANQGYWDGTTPTLVGANAPGYNYIQPGCTSQNAETVYLSYGADGNVIGLWAENAKKSFDFQAGSLSNVLDGARCANAASDGAGTGFAINVATGCTLTIVSIEVKGAVDWYLTAGSSHQGIDGIENIKISSDSKGKWKGIVRQRGTPTPGTLSMDGNRYLAVNGTNTPITLIQSWAGVGVPITLRANDDVPFASGGDITLPLNRSTGAEVPLLVLHKGDMMVLVRDDYPNTDKWKTVSINRVHQVAAAQPTTGWYAAGEFVANNSPVPSGGSVLLGWARITNETYAGSVLHHAAGVDWAPVYPPTVAAGVAYGSMYITTPAATTFADSVTMVKAAGTTTAGPLSNFTMPANNRLTYTGTPGILADIKVGVSITAAGNNKLTEMAIAKNGTVIAASRADRQIGTGADVGRAYVGAQVLLSTNDYLEFFILNETDTVSITVEYMTFDVLAHPT